MNFLYICLLSLFIFASCETEFSHTYIIKNNSNHSIQITGFDKIGAFSVVNDSATIYSENIFIEPNSEVTKVKPAGYHSEDQGVFDSSEVDSVTIIFDSIKIIIFACSQPNGISCSGKYNLMNYEDNYIKEKTGKSSGKEEYTYTYTITEEDYEMADSIK